MTACRQLYFHPAMRGMLWHLTVAMGLLWSPLAAAGLTPDWDPLADDMVMQPAPVQQIHSEDGLSAYARPIPRHIHQVWFGDLGRWFEGNHRQEFESTTMWRIYAQEHGLAYRLWTDADAPQLRAMMDSSLRALFDRAMQTGYFVLASDIARVVIVAGLGGMYFDCDMQPPRIEGAFVPLERIFPRTGLVLTTERFARSVGNTGIFVANGFMMAPPRHPVMAHLVQHLAAHAWHWTTKHDTSEAMYMVGCVPLNRALSGPFSVVSLDDMYALGVMHEDSPNWVAEPE